MMNESQPGNGANPLVRLHQFGQSVWLDALGRGMFASGELRRWIDEDGLLGATSNPTIFEKAIDGSRDYDGDIGALAREGKSAEQIYQALTIADVGRAADIFRPVYERLHGADYAVIPDRIEAGTFAVAFLATRGSGIVTPYPRNQLEKFDEILSHG